MFFGGGKSGFRRIHAHLKSDFESLLSESGEQIPNLALAARDNLTVRSVVNGIGDLAKHGLHLLTHLCQIRLTIKFGHRFHPQAPKEKEFQHPHSDNESTIAPDKFAGPSRESQEVFSPTAIQSG